MQTLCKCICTFYATNCTSGMIKISKIPNKNQAILKQNRKVFYFTANSLILYTISLFYNIPISTIYSVYPRKNTLYSTIYRGYIYIFQDFCRTSFIVMCSTSIIHLKIESETSVHPSVAFGENPVKSRLSRKSAKAKNSRNSSKNVNPSPRNPVKSTKN